MSVKGVKKTTRRRRTSLCFRLASRPFSVSEYACEECQRKEQEDFETTPGRTLFAADFFALAALCAAIWAWVAKAWHGRCSIPALATSLSGFLQTAQNFFPIVVFFLWNFLW